MSPEDVDVARAAQLFSQGDYTTVVAEFEPRLGDLRPAGWQYLAEALAKVGRTSDGVALMSVALDRDELTDRDRAYVLGSLGHIYETAGDREACLAAHDEQVRLAPTDRFALLDRVRADLRFAQATETGLAAAEALVELAPDDAECLRETLHLFAIARRHRATERCANMLLAIDPNDWWANADLGHVLTNSANYCRATRHIGRALRAAPDQRLVQQVAANLVNQWASIGVVLMAASAIAVLAVPFGSGSHPLGYLLTAGFGGGLGVLSVAVIDRVAGKGTTKTLLLLMRRSPDLLTARRRTAVWLGGSLLLLIGMITGQPLAKVGAAIALAEATAFDLWMYWRRLRTGGRLSPRELYRSLQSTD